MSIPTPVCPECMVDARRQKCMWELGPAGCARFAVLDEYRKRRKRANWLARKKRRKGKRGDR